MGVLLPVALLLLVLLLLPLLLGVGDCEAVPDTVGLELLEPVGVREGVLLPVGLSVPDLVVLRD